ncbi:hypothetical protein ACOME3_006790 [Neoechinorhynchus agilis]
MLIKEYRIVMPLSIAEYQRAQLYTIIKKSEDFTNSPGSAVTIRENRPYTGGPGGHGQYTKKVYQIADHLPGWLKSILPQDAMMVEEYSWNAYPYTKTKYVYPFVDRFCMEVETKYLPDCGQQENVFNLQKRELNVRQVDYIDFVNDPLDRMDVDPKAFVSKSTGRGPLESDWMDPYLKGKIEPIMCAYKLCRIEFKCWGLQSRVERFIDDNALRKTFLSAHRAVWCWQDEWSSLTIEDIREMEQAVQERLEQRVKAMKNIQKEEAFSNEVIVRTQSIHDEPLTESSLRIWSNKLSMDLTGINEDSSHADIDDPCIKDEFSDSEEFWDARSRRTTLASISPMFRQRRSESAYKHWLILLFYAGKMDDLTESRLTNLITFNNTIDKANQYTGRRLYRPIIIKLVRCSSLSSEIMKQLSSISIVQSSSNSAHVMGHLLTTNRTYQQHLDLVIENANSCYDDFCRSLQEVKNLSVNIVGDGIGSVFAYDALSRNSVAGKKLKFPVENLFCLGSSIGTLLLQRKLSFGENPLSPKANFFNIFLSNDPSASRVEPVLDQKFQFIPSASIERFFNVRNISYNNPVKELSSAISFCDLWENEGRLDYCVYAPQVLSQLPQKFLDIVISSSYWENEDIAIFILNKLDKNQEARNTLQYTESTSTEYRSSRYDFSNALNRVMKNLTPNHSASDVLLGDAYPQVLTAKFSYGPLKVVPLSYGKVEIYSRVQENDPYHFNMGSGQRKEYMFLGNGITDAYGNLSYHLKERLLFGSYDVKIIVSADNSTVEFGVYVVNQNSKAVVFGVGHDSRRMGTIS